MVYICNDVSVLHKTCDFFILFDMQHYLLTPFIFKDCNLGLTKIDNLDDKDLLMLVKKRVKNFNENNIGGSYLKKFSGGDVMCNAGDFLRCLVETLNNNYISPVIIPDRFYYKSVIENAIKGLSSKCII